MDLKPPAGHRWKISAGPIDTYIIRLQRKTRLGLWRTICKRRVNVTPWNAVSQALRNQKASILVAQGVTL